MWSNTSNAYIDGLKLKVANDLQTSGKLPQGTSIKSIIPKLFFGMIIMEKKLDPSLPEYSFSLRESLSNDPVNKGNEITLKDKDILYPLFLKGEIARYSTVAGVNNGNMPFPTPYIDAAVHTEAGEVAALRTIWNSGAIASFKTNNEDVHPGVSVRDMYINNPNDASFDGRGYMRFRPNVSVNGIDDPELIWNPALS